MLIRTKCGVLKKRLPFRFFSLEFLRCKNSTTLETAASMPPKTMEVSC
jgi:hypothetical protein